jgi:hypothetical protein
MVFIVFQTPQDWVAAERISFKLVTLLHVRQEVLFSLREFREEISSFLLHFLPVDSAMRLALHFAQSKHWRLGSATDAVPLPKTKPRAMREHLVVPSVRSLKVARTQRSSIRRFEHFLQLLNLLNGAFNVHASQSSKRRRWAVNRKRQIA